MPKSRKSIEKVAFVRRLRPLREEINQLTLGPLANEVVNERENIASI